MPNRFPPRLLTTMGEGLPAPTLETAELEYGSAQAAISRHASDAWALAVRHVPAEFPFVADSGRTSTLRSFFDFNRPTSAESSAC